MSSDQKGILDSGVGGSLQLFPMQPMTVWVWSGSSPKSWACLYVELNDDQGNQGMARTLDKTYTFLLLEKGGSGAVNAEQTSFSI